MRSGGKNRPSTSWGRRWEPKDTGTPKTQEERMEETSALLRYERDFAQDGPTFERLNRAHPNADDAEARPAIVAAVKFDRDCFRYFSYGRADDYWETVIRAVARAAADGPPYLETTYRCPQLGRLSHEVAGA
jgi:hypothetical protein